MITDWNLLIPLGLILLTSTGVWLMMSGSRRKNQRIAWPAFRVHIGTALLISAITIVLVDLQLKREIKTEVDRIPRAILNYVCHGNEELQKALENQIVNDEIVYSDLEINATLEAVLSENPPYASYNWTTVFKVKNTSDHRIYWTFHPTVISDFDNPKAKIEEKPVLMEEGTNSNIISDKDWEVGYIPQDPNATGTARDRAEFTKPDILLQPGKTYRVKIVRYVNDRLKVGTIVIRNAHCVQGVVYNMSAKPSDFEIEIQANYPGRRTEQLVPAEFSRNSVPFPPYEIGETLLPYEGFTIQYRYRHPLDECQRSSNVQPPQINGK